MSSRSRSTVRMGSKSRSRSMSRSARPLARISRKLKPCKSYQRRTTSGHCVNVENLWKTEIVGRKGVGKMLKSGRRSMGKIHRRIPCTGDEVRMPSGQCAKKTRGIHHRRPLGQGKNKMVPCKSNQHRSASTHRCVNNRTNSPRSPRVAY